MKNRKTASGKILLLLMLVTSTFGIGQNLKIIKIEKNSLDNSYVEPYELIFFNVESEEGKNYINWRVKSSSDNYYFVLARSFDGENYSIINRRKGSISPSGKILQYLFIDEISTDLKNTYYRIELHKIMAIDLEYKMISLSSRNIFENNLHSTLIVQPTQAMLAEFSNE